MYVELEYYDFIARGAWGRGVGVRAARLAPDVQYKIITMCIYIYIWYAYIYIYIYAHHS